MQAVRHRQHQRQQQAPPTIPDQLRVFVCGKERLVEGLFVLERYLADQDCIWFEHKWVTRSGFEKAAGSSTAKWHCSIKVRCT